MQVVFHIGAHSTDEDRLLKSLLKNKAELARQGIVVPGPSRYRQLVRETVQALKGAAASADVQELLLDATMEQDTPAQGAAEQPLADRLVLSNEHFICVVPRIFENGRLYDQTEEKIAALSNLFPGCPVEFHLSVSNPATFIPTLLARKGDLTYETLLQGTDPMGLQWSGMVERIRTANPAAALTVWCNEDTPLIWSQLLREISGVEPVTRLVGSFDLLAEIMTPDGLKRFRAYLDSHPPQTEIQLRRIISAFLDKFAIEDQIELELDLPGWTDVFVDSLTELYEEDMFRIQRMPGVNFITP